MRVLTVTDETADRVQALLSNFAGVPTDKLPRIRRLWDEAVAVATTLKLVESAQEAPTLTKRINDTFNALHGGSPSDPAELSNDAA